MVGNLSILLKKIDSVFDLNSQVKFASFHFCEIFNGAGGLAQMDTDKEILRSASGRKNQISIYFMAF